MIHADSKETNLIDQKAFYVGISRAKETVEIFTNERAGQVQTRPGLARRHPDASGGQGDGGRIGLILDAIKLACGTQQITMASMMSGNVR